MALGMIERCIELCIDYAKERVQFGQPIGEFQLIQEKLARMEVARLNVQNLVFRFLEMSAAGERREHISGVNAIERGVECDVVFAAARSDERKLHPAAVFLG